MSTPRVRFAPSPTGHLHVGGARTALFNWLFARGEGGAFLLRIEDTDRARSSEEMTRGILEALAWLGLEADEEPAHQADGLERHRRDVGRLLEGGAAYRCFCSPEELEARREAARGGKDGDAYAYDGRCRELDAEDAEARADAGEPFAVRFAVPPGTTAWEDVVHGRVAFDHAEIEDFVLLRSDGTPVYNLAAVSDDVDMGITHVLRGDDHLSNTPKQILLHRALGVEPPAFAHLPLIILGPDGSRLSKRHGAVSVEAYRRQGILPEAMVNFLALLGWSPGDDREVMDVEELVEAFSLERILKKSAVFDVEKLLALNRRHIARAPAERLAGPVARRLEAAGRVSAAELEAERERFHRVLNAVKERPDTLDLLAEQVAPFFAEEVDYQEDAVARFWKDPAAAARVLRALAEALEATDPWELEALERDLRARADELGVGAGRLIHPLRVALMGVAVSPGIFTVLHLMGRERTLRRIDAALGWLDAAAAVEP